MTSHAKISQCVVKHTCMSQDTHKECRVRADYVLLHIWSKCKHTITMVFYNNIFHTHLHSPPRQLFVADVNALQAFSHSKSSMIVLWNSSTYNCLFAKYVFIFTRATCMWLKLVSLCQAGSINQNGLLSLSTWFTFIATRFLADLHMRLQTAN